MLNRVVLVGRLTRDPELRYTPSNVAVATFTIAVNRPFSNRNQQQDQNMQGTNQPTADYIPVVVWRNQAENVKRYTTQGSMVAVEGRIQTRNYDGNDGVRRYVTEVVADNVVFLETKGSQEALNQRNTSNVNNNNNNYYQEPQRDQNSGNDDSYDNNIVFTKDDLPY